VSSLFSFLFNCKSQNENEKFKVGQVWKYETRINEENSTLQILKIEKVKNQESIVHIYISGLKMKNPNHETGISEFIGHLPISEHALSNSTTKLVLNNKKLPNFKEGYEMWKTAFDSGNAGYFTESVNNAINFIEEALIKTKNKQ